MKKKFFLTGKLCIGITLCAYIIAASCSKDGSLVTSLDSEMSGLKAAPAITKTNDVQMTTSGLTVVSYGGYMNGESFQQDGILTYNGYQYTCFWNTNRHVILARRKLPTGSWSKIEISTYTNTSSDAHNTISLGVCPNDGTLHVSFDHHGNDLHYIKSVVNLVTNPSGVAWATASFGAVTSYLVSSTKVTGNVSTLRNNAAG